MLISVAIDIPFATAIWQQAEQSTVLPSDDRRYNKPVYAPVDIYRISNGFRISHKVSQFVNKLRGGLYFQIHIYM